MHESTPDAPRRRTFLAALWCASLSIGTVDCRQADVPVSPAVRQTAAPSARLGPEPLRFAVGSMISPATTYEIYEDILRHVAAAAGRPFVLLQRRSYQEINELLLSGQVDLAFICSGAFASLPAEADLEILAVPVVRGLPVYHSLIITRTESDIEGLADLRGKRFAFTDPLSHTGYFYPLARLADLGESPTSFFASTTMTGSHDRSIAAVHRKLVDAAAVDSLVFHKVVTPDSRYAGKLEIVETSPGFPIPPFVAPKSLDPELRHALQRALLELHASSEGRALLDAIGVERFTEGDASAYQVIKAYAERAGKGLRR